MERLPRRKLLVASVGVAAVSYVAIGASCNGPTVANLPAPPPTSTPSTTATVPPTAANLPAPPPTVANLPAPPPIDSGSDANADAGDAGKDAG